MAMRSAAPRAFVVLLLGVTIVQKARAADEPPLAVTAIDPSHGPSGTKMKLVGRGFRGTKKVRFVVGQLKTKEAKFRAVSDTELEVHAPEYLTTDLQAAIIVESGAGVTVTVPRYQLRTISNPSSTRGDKFLNVRAGGTSANGGTCVTVIDKDGTVSMTGRATLIAKGGRVDNAFARADRSASFIYAEPGALIADKARLDATVFQVPHVYCSPIDELFTYEAVKDESQASYDTQQARAPHISSIKPNDGEGGDIVEIHGTGLSSARSVEFFESGIQKRHSAPFRIQSDTVLRVEVPAMWRAVGHQMPMPALVIVNLPGGIAFTLPRAVQPKTTPNSTLQGELVTWIGRGGSISGGVPIALVDDGGLLTKGGGTICFVKNGGTIVQRQSLTVYYEPNAKLDDAVRQSGSIVEVPKINACTVDAYFNSQRAPSHLGTGR
jgi:hypothetical protein